MRKNIVVSVIALFLMCICCCCEDEPDCTDPDNDPQGNLERSVGFETLEVKVVPLEMDDPLGEELEVTVEGDWSPFYAEVVDYLLPDANKDSVVAKALRIAAPEFPLMPGSDYLTDNYAVATVSNECGDVTLGFSLYMAYGCEPISPQIDEWDSGMRHLRVVGSRYQQDTGITIESGQKVNIFAEGQICWSIYDQATCRGVAQDVGNTWGVWAKIGSDYYPLEETITIEHNGVSGQLSFIVPDGPRPEETITAGDEEYCTTDYYKDSGGPGIDVSFYIE